MDPFHLTRIQTLEVKLIPILAILGKYCFLNQIQIQEKNIFKINNCNIGYKLKSFKEHVLLNQCNLFFQFISFLQ